MRNNQQIRLQNNNGNTKKKERIGTTLRRENKLIWILCLFVGISMIIYSASDIYMEKQYTKDAEKRAADLLEAYESETTNADIIGTLEIPDLELKLAILSISSEKNLDTSICKFSGPDIGEIGHLVIAGKHYQGGILFGGLGFLSEGSEIILTTREGESFYYEVYDKETVTANDKAALSQYQGKRGLTLFSAATLDSDRLLVRCQEKTNR